MQNTEYVNCQLEIVHKNHKNNNTALFRDVGRAP